MERTTPKEDVMVRNVPGLVFMDGTVPVERHRGAETDEVWASFRNEVVHVLAQTEDHVPEPVDLTEFLGVRALSRFYSGYHV